MMKREGEGIGKNKRRELGKRILPPRKKGGGEGMFSMEM
jgi:hypothetical protein